MIITCKTITSLTLSKTKITVTKCIIIYFNQLNFSRKRSLMRWYRKRHCLAACICRRNKFPFGGGRCFDELNRWTYAWPNQEEVLHQLLHRAVEYFPRLCHFFCHWQHLGYNLKMLYKQHSHTGACWILLRKTMV